MNLSHRGILTTLLISFSSELCHSGGFETNRPIFLGNGKHRYLSLPYKMNEALYRTFPTFRPLSNWRYSKDVFAYFKPTPTEAPFAVIGDFNGDGIQDVILDGQSRGNWIRACILSNKISFDIITIFSRKPADSDSKYCVYLSLVKPGKFNSSYEEHPLWLKTDAVLNTFPEKGASILFYRGGQFHSYTVSD